jgi:hypothetical protein
MGRRSASTFQHAITINNMTGDIVGPRHLSLLVPEESVCHQPIT